MDMVTEAVQRVDTGTLPQRLLRRHCPLFAQTLGGVAFRSHRAELNTPRISVRFFMSLDFFGR